MMVEFILFPSASVTMIGIRLAGIYSMMEVTSSASVHCRLWRRRT
ncbi:Uncharacterised protein [Serratia marcescens]|nr:Uncharacterised protein [Serratia marcescens]